MDFNKLIGGTTVPPTPSKGKKVNFESLVPNKKPKLTEKQLSEIEPGNKIPITQYKQIGMVCEACNDVTMHILKKDKRVIMCMDCKLETKK